MSDNWVAAVPTPEIFRINRVLYDIQHDRAEEARFFADRRAYVDAIGGLSAQAADALVANDWTRLYLLGANPYLMRAYCLQLRIPEPEYLASLRRAGEESSHG